MFLYLIDISVVTPKFGATVALAAKGMVLNYSLAPSNWPLNRPVVAYSVVETLLRYNS